MNIIYIMAALTILAISTGLLVKQKLYQYTYPMVLIAVLSFIVILDVRERIINVAVGTVQVSLRDVQDATDQARIATTIVRSNAIASAKLIVPTFYPPPREGIAFTMDIVGAYPTRERYISNLKQLGASEDEIIELRKIGNDAAIRRLMEAIINRVFAKNHTNDWPDHLKLAVISDEWSEAEYVDKMIKLFKNEPNSGNAYASELTLLGTLHSYLTANPDGTVSFNYK